MFHAQMHNSASPNSLLEKPAKLEDGRRFLEAMQWFVAAAYLRRMIVCAERPGRCLVLIDEKGSPHPGPGTGTICRRRPSGGQRLIDQPI